VNTAIAAGTAYDGAASWGLSDWISYLALVPALHVTYLCAAPELRVMRHNPNGGAVLTAVCDVG
jgi:hypothetical protein